MSQATNPEYQVALGRLMPLSMAGPALEICQKIPNIHDVMPEPFDITNHAGNMWVGSLMAGAAVLAYAGKKGTEEVPLAVDQESISNFRRFGVAAICGATALANCITETKWGVKNLPIAEALGGTTPDVLDTMYSTVWAGLLSSVLFWRKR